MSMPDDRPSGEPIPEPPPSGSTDADLGGIDVTHEYLDAEGRLLAAAAGWPEVLAYAHSFLGRYPPGRVAENINRFTIAYYGNRTRAAWCLIFVWYVLKHFGLATWKLAYVPWLDRIKGEHSGHSGIKVGAICAIAGFSHVGFFIADHGSTFDLLSGNSTSGSSSDAITVKRYSKSIIAGYVNVTYPTSPSPGDGMLHGFDVSAFQDSTVPACDFVFVKATEGTAYTSSKFGAQWASAKVHAKVRGAYHFARPEQGSAAHQADRLIAIASPRPGEMLCLDLEASKLSQAETNAWAREFGDRLRSRAPGVTTVVYLGSGYATNGTGKDLNKHYDLWWYPQYPSTAKTSTWRKSFDPWLPSGLTCGWSNPHIWQWTNNFNGVDASISQLSITQLANGGDIPEDDVQLDEKIHTAQWVLRRYPNDQFLKANLDVESTLANTYGNSRIAKEASERLETLVAGLQKTVAALAAGSNLDADAVARAVLAQLTPAAIAAAVADSLPADLAEQVVTELGSRIKTQ